MEIKVRIGSEAVNSVDQKLFGQFIEHIENCILGGVCDPGNPLSDAGGIRLDVLEKCRELAPPILRFPGGTVIGIYHWEDHVGPVESRKKMRNVVWGDRLCHEFGTAEFVQYCRAIGAEPMLCVNMPTGSPEEAAHWVEYCNGTEDSYYANLRRSHGFEEPFGVKYWCIGNESFAEPDLGRQHNVDVYVSEAWEYAKYMKLTDPSIKLVLVGYDEAWNRRVLDSMQGVCDYLSLHMYARSPDWERLARFEQSTLLPLERLLEEYNGRDYEFSKWYRFPRREGRIRIALDEWNIWDNRPTEQSRHGFNRSYDWNSALWVASFLQMLIRHSESIGIANMAQMVNVIAPITANESGSWRQTIFYPMRDYRKYCGESLLPLEQEGGEAELCATRTADGKTVLFAVNKTGEETVLLLDRKAEWRKLLDAEDPCAVNTEKLCIVREREDEALGRRVTLPPYSISVIRLSEAEKS